MPPVKLRHLHWKHGAYYWVGRRDGKVVWTRLAADMPTALLKRVGLVSAHWHDLRATCLTRAKEQGGLDYAQTLAGHARQATTEGYIAQRSVTKVRPIR